MNTSTAVTGYIAALFLVGLGMAIFGTLLPLGGGITIMAVGEASIGTTIVSARQALANDSRADDPN